MINEIIRADCLDWMKTRPDRSVDLVFCSSPYEAARTYGIDFNLRGQAWVDWCLPRYLECCRISRGLVAWVVEGQTRNYRYSATPLLLMADLHRAGVNLRKPPIFHRVGIPGSGGPDWLRNDYEFIVCATPPGRLPWSENTACGHPPKWAPGGTMSNRHADGQRKNSRQSTKNPRKSARGKNQWGHSIDSGATVVDAGGVVRSKGKRPSHFVATPSETQRVNGADGNLSYAAPAKANPGNKSQRTYSTQEVAGILDAHGFPADVISRIVGGGVMGSKLAHENEAPFPESLAEFFIRSFCPLGGTVLDPFCGSGTTCAVAKRLGRNWLGIDIRESQVELSRRRLAEVKREAA